MRLMLAVDDGRRIDGAPFQVLVVSDLDRIGREQLETGYLLKQLSLGGVRVFTYLEDREVLLDSPAATFMMQAQRFGAALEREKGI
jgi:DNA invertase Pin-like site-specific DNA recombinase